VTPDHVLTVKRIFALANRAYFLYLTRNTAERGELLKSVLLNCSTDGASYCPTYRKPFELIFERAKTENWSALADDFRTFLFGVTCPHFPHSDFTTQPVAAGAVGKWKTPWLFSKRALRASFP
jgi:hypothetical protein